MNRSTPVRSAMGLLLLTTGLSATAVNGFTICSEADPPPWIYWQRDRDNNKTDILAGFSIDLMRFAFQKIGQNADFISLPWKRCKKYLEDKKVDFAMDVPMVDEYIKNYEYSIHYNTLTPQVFYSKNRNFVAKNVIDLKKYRECNVLSTELRKYSLGTGNASPSTDDDVGLIKKLKAGRCQYFIEDLEFIAGYGRIGNNLLNDDEIDHQSIEGAIPTTYHLVALRGSVAASLIPRLDGAIADAVKSGLASRFWALHAGEAIAYVP